MPDKPGGKRSATRSLRLWPGVVIVALQWLGRFGLPAIDPDLAIYGVFAGFGGTAALLIWWLFFSRAAWADRLGALAAMAAALAITWPFLDVSMATGAMGMIFPMLAMPGICLAFVMWAVAAGHLPAVPRRVSMVAALLLACGVWTLIRTGGFTGSFDNDLAWRWTPTAEELLLAQPDEPLAVAPAPPVAPAPAPSLPTATVAEPAAAAASDEAPAEAAAPAAAVEPASPGFDWPGFRGGSRDGIVRGVRIATDWTASPPEELWRRPVGPGWSSFSVRGDVFYTQEQRGDDEVVAAYRVSTGAPVWMHRDPARFYESNGGPGPRGTPTLSGGRVYAFGATGILNVLDGATGRVHWSRNVATDTGIRIPDWGFASSPLLAGDIVIVAAAGTLVAYDRGTGAPRWTGPRGGAGYSSPQAFTIHGVPQVVLLDGHGATSVSPADGMRLWDVALTTSPMAAPIVQPGLTPDGDLLIDNGQGSGMFRVAVTQGPDGWTTSRRWSTNGLKPYFNDFVVHRGHAFGFDGSILASIDLADGKRKWKGGRYGNGQMVLLADQDLLLVVSEEGELALVSAATDKYSELARVPAIAGKTWNHPVVVGDVLLVRNGEEMAAFRLPVANR
jgi:outer membrane protein assembly factor BamB